MKKFYVVETNYVGPNTQVHIDGDELEIRTSPALYNSSRKPCISGWAGTTNDWATYAHGEFSDITSAMKYVRENWGTRDAENNPCDEHVLRTFKIGNLQPLTREETENYIWPEIGLIPQDITDDEIRVRIDDWTEAAEIDGYALDCKHAERLIFDHLGR